MKTNIAIVRPKEVVNNPSIAKTMEHLITVTHSDKVSSDEVIGMLRAAFTCYTLEKRQDASGIQMTLEEAFDYIKKYRFIVKVVKSKAEYHWERINTLKVLFIPFSTNVSSLCQERTFLNNSVFNRYGLQLLFGNSYIIERVDCSKTNNYYINAIVKTEFNEDHGWEIYVYKSTFINTEVEVEDNF